MLPLAAAKNKPSLLQRNLSNEATVKPLQEYSEGFTTHIHQTSRKNNLEIKKKEDGVLYSSQMIE
jgi:hypothetical protein